MYKRIIAQAGMKGKRQMRSCTPGTQGAAMSMDYPPIMAGVDGIKPPPADLESAVLSLN